MITYIVELAGPVMVLGIRGQKCSRKKQYPGQAGEFHDLSVQLPMTKYDPSKCAHILFVEQTYSLPPQHDDSGFSGKHGWSPVAGSPLGR